MPTKIQHGGSVDGNGQKVWRLYERSGVPSKICNVVVLVQYNSPTVGDRWSNLGYTPESGILDKNVC